MTGSLLWYLTLCLLIAYAVAAVAVTIRLILDDGEKREARRASRSIDREWKDMTGR